MDAMRPAFGFGGEGDAEEAISPEERKRRHRARRTSARLAEGDGVDARRTARASFQRNQSYEDARAIFLLGLHEIESLFGDVVAGLDFLVRRDLVSQSDRFTEALHILLVGSTRIQSCIWILSARTCSCICERAT